MNVLLQVVCIAHSPVCSTLRIALRKIVNSFNEFGGGGGGGWGGVLKVQGSRFSFICHIHNHTGYNQ